MRNGLQKLLRRLHVICSYPYMAILSCDVGQRLYSNSQLAEATTSTTATEPIAHENQTSPRLSKLGCDGSVEAQIKVAAQARAQSGMEREGRTAVNSTVQSWQSKACRPRWSHDSDPKPSHQRTTDTCPTDPDRRQFAQRSARSPWRWRSASRYAAAVRCRAE